MQYKVPQNIDQEDKILGPLTFVQFIYVLIGGAIVILSLALFDTALFLLISIPTIILTACFALIKVQDQPFSRFFVAFLHYIRRPKRWIWQDAEDEVQQQISEANAAQTKQQSKKNKKQDIASPATAKPQATVVQAAPKRAMDMVGTRPVSSPKTAQTTTVAQTTTTPIPTPQNQAAPGGRTQQTVSIKSVIQQGGR